MEHANSSVRSVFTETIGMCVATATTCGTIYFPKIKRQNYNVPLFLGSLAAGGTLGILIPPSINLIIYGVLTDTSVPRLYLAGILPGIGIALLFMLMIAIACTLKPAWGGKLLRSNCPQRKPAPDNI